MAVSIDEPRGDDKAGAIDHALRFERTRAVDGDYPMALDCHVGFEAARSRTIDDDAAFKY
jgi:hypothetical protein